MLNAEILNCYADMLSVVMLSPLMLNVIMLIFIRRHRDCEERPYTECSDAEWHFYECPMLSTLMLNGIMLSALMLNGIMLSDILLKVPLGLRKTPLY